MSLSSRVPRNPPGEPAASAVFSVADTERNPLLHSLSLLDALPGKRLYLFSFQASEDDDAELFQWPHTVSGEAGRSAAVAAVRVAPGAGAPGTRP